VSALLRTTEEGRESGVGKTRRKRRQRSWKTVDTGGGGKRKGPKRKDGEKEERSALGVTPLGSMSLGQGGEETGIGLVESKGRGNSVKKGGGTKVD